jgi:tRNAThr (cytosine32-N3)-methyltransferase
MSPYQKAREAVDQSHAGDPRRDAAGQALELLYADNMETWLLRLDPSAGELLRLGARCQHLERWTTPRESFPMDKTGYHAWRRHLYKEQADKARRLLLASGVSAEEADQVHTWVSKTDLRGNAGTQALEDAACLVFLETEIVGFAQRHADYTEEKLIAILRRTWAKMSVRARSLALTLQLPQGLSALVRKATADL